MNTFVSIIIVLRRWLLKALPSLEATPHIRLEFANEIDAARARDAIKKEAGYLFKDAAMTREQFEAIHGDMKIAGFDVTISSPASTRPLPARPSAPQGT